MKAKLTKKLGAAALIAALLVPAAIAQDKGSAKGGATKLLPPVLVYPATPASAMACIACTDTLVTAANREARGGGARDLIGRNEVTLAKHLCASCGVTFETRGHGKAKTDAAVHTCAGCAERAKAAGATKAEVTKVTGATGMSCCKDTAKTTR
jgi:hypothetical protein